MDDAMIGALLKTYGAPTTVDNANRARQFFATNPEIAEKRAMGLRGSGIDDNSDIFGAQLDKLIAASSTPEQTGSMNGQIAPVHELYPIETVQQATQPTRRSATAAPSSNKTYPEPREAQGTPNNAGGPIPTATAGAGKGFGWDDLLTALLGASSVAGRTIMGGGAAVDPNAPSSMETKLRQVGGPDPRMPRLTYQPKLEEGGANARANQSTVVQEDPALTNEGKKAQIQAEVDAENAEAKRLQDQIMQRQRGQASTRDLLKNAKRTITGR